MWYCEVTEVVILVRGRANNHAQNVVAILNRIRQPLEGYYSHAFTPIISISSSIKWLALLSWAEEAGRMQILVVKWT